MTEQLKSDDKIFSMFKNYLFLLSEDAYATSRNYKEPETIALGLTLAHQIDHVVCEIKKENPPKVHQIEI